jgi:hypothetical protein
LDNGWDAETAVSNIEKALQALDIELFTHVLDWESFKDLQVAFLKASTPDAEIPTDHAIFSLLYDIAAREGVRYILGGTNQQTESVMPRAWSWGHNDWRYIRSIHEEFGTRPLKRYPHRTLWKTAWYRWVRRIRWVGILNYVDYIKEDAAAVLEREIGWRPYGAKHHESIYTRFYQEHILPVKFGFDKRKAHLSSLIVSGQMTREAALRELAKPLSPDARSLEADTEYVVGKLGLTRPEFERLMALPPRRFEDYPSYESYPPVQFLRRVYRRLKGRPV